MGKIRAAHELREQWHCNLATHKEECRVHRKPIDCFDGFAFEIGLSSLGHRLLVACSTFVGSGAQTHQRWAKMGPQSFTQVKPEILRRELSVTGLC